jgi:hypothetical protein
MSTLVDLLQPLRQPAVADVAVLEPEAPPVVSQGSWDQARFAEAQIRSLVRQVFFPGRPKPPHHVVFSAVDETTYVAEICMEVAKELAAQVNGSVCLIEANPQNPELETVFWRNDGSSRFSSDPGSLRSSSQNIDGNLWLAPLKLLLGPNPARPTGDSLARRLSDFRLEFDHTLFHGPPAGRSSEAAFLGHLSDGLVLVLQANSTRRAAALKVKDILQASQTRLLGAVLSERTFPIPQRIYKKL